MFGLLISGRLVDTAFRQVDATHCVIDIPDSSTFSHVVVSSADSRGQFLQSEY
jgi:hypothetical protein